MQTVSNLFNFLVGAIGGFSSNGKAVHLYTNSLGGNPSIVAVSQDGTMSAAQTLVLSTNIEISNIECKNIVAKTTTCLLKKNSNNLEIVEIAGDSQSRNWAVSSSGTYEYYQDYIPTIWSFNEEYLVTKAVNSNSELMLTYKKEDKQSNKVWWGLKPEEYYNSKGSIFTASLPLVYKNSQKNSVLMFTQKANTEGVNQSNSQIFKPFNFGACLINLKSDINENEAPTVSILFEEANNQSKAVPISKVFDKHPPAPAPPTPPTPPGPAPKKNHFLMIAFIIVAVLIVIIVLLLLNNRNKDGDDDSDDQEFRRVQDIEQGKTVTTVSITKPENNIGLGMEYDE